MLYQSEIEAITGTTLKAYQRLSGGMIGDVFRIDLANGDRLVAKESQESDATLHIEGRMLNYLNTHSDFPLPQVIHNDKHLLLMTYIPNNGGITGSVQADAAQHIAALHNITQAQHGLDFDTLIGPLHQPNPLTDSWIDFFREQRLLYMGDIAYRSGRLPAELRTRIDKLADQLDQFLIEPAHASLIHGDIWGGNVLTMNGKIAGFIDPAIYYGHAEVELAYIALFGTFGQAFFEAYQTIRPIEPEFFTVRKGIYSLYPLLVHVHIFGGGYVAQVGAILDDLGV